MRRWHLTGRHMTTRQQTAPAIILASSSRYRRELLQRLQLDFDCRSPDIDENAGDGESPWDLVRRLAEAKAVAIAGGCDEPALVIGSDQVAILDDEILGKPGTAEAAVQQLQHMRGCRIDFLTGLCVLNTDSASRRLDVVPYSIKFRQYSDAEIRRYLAAEQPFDCAGSFRSEALGITLAESMSGSDPTALIGLPLIRLCEMLRLEGIELP